MSGQTVALEEEDSGLWTFADPALALGVPLSMLWEASSWVCCSVPDLPEHGNLRARAHLMYAACPLRLRARSVFPLPSLER